MTRHYNTTFLGLMVADGEAPPVETFFLLKEDGDALLKEDNDHILKEDAP